VLEGMALGKPVVATAHGGPLDVVVEGETGFLTAPGDATELAAVLVRLLGDADLRQRVGAAGRARLLDKFTAERNVRQLERVLLAAR
jgi:glycosyltransferase involved in cell wall biosynthesis